MPADPLRLAVEGNLALWGARPSCTSGWDWVQQYAYDAVNMLTEHHDHDGGPGTTPIRTTRFVYTADDERIAREEVENSRTTWTVRDLNGQVLRTFEEDTQTGALAWKKDYVWQSGKLVASEEPNSGSGTIRLHYHLDHLGTPRLVTNAGGGFVRRHDYYPFGQEVLPQNMMEPMRFTGHEKDFAGMGGEDKAGDLEYMHARYYSAGIGRFLSIDPINSGRSANPQSWNRYAYGLNNPLRFLDPNGRTVVGFTGFLNDPTGGIARVIDRLVPRSRLLGRAALFNHQDTDLAVDLILRRQASPNPGAITALLGHSLGARAALRAARELQGIEGAPLIDLLATVDPAPNLRGARLVPSNVRTAINFRQTGMDLGGDVLRAEDPSRTRVFNITLGLGHGAIDEAVVESIVTFVLELAQEGELDLEQGLQLIQGEVVRVE